MTTKQLKDSPTCIGIAGDVTTIDGIDRWNTVRSYSDGTTDSFVVDAKDLNMSLLASDIGKQRGGDDNEAT